MNLNSPLFDRIRTRTRRAEQARAEAVIRRHPGLVPAKTIADIAGLPRIVQARKGPITSPG